MKTLLACILLVGLYLSIQLSAGESRVVDSMDALTFKAPKEKGAVEAVEGKDGKALKFSFEKDAASKMAIGSAKGAADWDSAAGISFWVKGDGSDHLGGIEFIWNEDYSIRYAFAFSISETKWHKVSVRWSDLIPETCNEKALPLGKGGNAPSKLGAIAFGKWWYWRDYAAHSYCIDDIRLEAEIPESKVEDDPVDLSTVLAKLKAGKPITIVTMGDSLTDFNHWANKPVNWPTLLKDSLHEKYKSDVKIVNPAMGGTELRQNLILIPRWLHQVPEPDLVTIWFGGNDWNSGMRWLMFDATLKDAVARVRRATHGKAAVLLLSTCPSVERWDTMLELNNATCTAAFDAKTNWVDIYSIFHREGATDKERLYCRDKTHLSPAGHELVAKSILDAIEKY